jgi:hypothetical protein
MKKTIMVAMLAAFCSVSFAQQTPSSGNSTLDNAMNQAKNQGGDFNSRVNNPFIFCSAPKPPKKNPMRAVFDQICGDSQKAQAAANPVPVPTGNPQSDTKALQDKFNQMNVAK